MAGRVTDITGEQFGRWTVLSVAGKSNGGSILWLCHCKCGNEKVVNGASLRKGESRSCGCLHNELASARASDRTGKQCHNYRGGQNTRGSEAFFNKRLRSGFPFAERGGYEPVNLTGKELSELYAGHTHTCDVCGTPEKELSQGLCIDHCHETGDFRGFLCNKCNSALGMVHDDPDLLQKLMEYLSPVGV